MRREALQSKRTQEVGNTYPTLPPVAGGAKRNPGHQNMTQSEAPKHECFSALPLSILSYARLFSQIEALQGVVAKLATRPYMCDWDSTLTINGWLAIVILALHATMKSSQTLKDFTSLS